jgi:hypothetical protein
MVLYIDTAGTSLSQRLHSWVACTPAAGFHCCTDVAGWLLLLLLLLLLHGCHNTISPLTSASCRARRG